MYPSAANNNKRCSEKVDINDNFSWDRQKKQSMQHYKQPLNNKIPCRINILEQKPKNLIANSSAFALADVVILQENYSNFKTSIPPVFSLEQEYAANVAAAAVVLIQTKWKVKKSRKYEKIPLKRKTTLNCGRKFD